jgi:hypothetical protein
MKLKFPLNELKVWLILNPQTWNSTNGIGITLNHVLKWRNKTCCKSEVAIFTEPIFHLVWTLVLCRESRFLRDPDDEIPPSFLHFFLFAFIAEHRQSKILTTRKKTLGNCKETSGVLAAVPCRPSGTFWDGWDLSLPTLAGKWFLEERVHSTNYVDHFYNTNCL